MSADLVEQAKKTAAQQAVDEYFDLSFTHVGIGSGSTIKYIVDAIKDKATKAGSSKIQFVPTGKGSKSLVDGAGLTALPFEKIPENQLLDVAFDGADEVDDELNLIKGGGLCLFQEKIVACRARKFVVVADFRKNSKRLLTNWTYIPVEVVPIAANAVLKELRGLGSPNPTVREATGVPVETDQNFYIVSAPFPQLLTVKDRAPAAGGSGKTSDGQDGKYWEAERLATAIKMIPGVLEVGLFVGANGPEALKKGGRGGQKPVAVFFGNQDGSVEVKRVS